MLLWVDLLPISEIVLLPKPYYLYRVMTRQSSKQREKQINQSTSQNPSHKPATCSISYIHWLGIILLTKQYAYAINLRCKHKVWPLKKLSMFLLFLVGMGFEPNGFEPWSNQSNNLDLNIYRCCYLAWRLALFRLGKKQWNEEDQSSTI